ncbi:MAG: hypothetical protein CML68_25225 [Rhodobacteraceae bacterium]|nr:hypothetical protein [Paracoccaceae bacterium]
MKCPIDGTQLVMTDRSGVEIDYCPDCRGVWLDRGELDKIIERTPATAAPPPPPRERSRDERAYETVRRYGDDDDRYDDRYGRKKKRRSSFLDDLFDF